MHTRATLHCTQYLVLNERRSIHFFLQRSLTSSHTHVHWGSSLKSRGRVVMSQHHVYLYSAFWDIFYMHPLRMTNNDHMPT